MEGEGDKRRKRMITSQIFWFKNAKNNIMKKLSVLKAAFIDLKIWARNYNASLTYEKHRFVYLT